jgi:hypothetical protein
MKMVKSLLLGSAAGLFAVAGAQAADLPVKAKPVEYVKVCSLYGAGFYYIPGTDTCIKIGGFVRTEWLHNAAGSFAPYASGADALFTRNTNTLRNRSRFIMSMDVRSQTEYGTLRAYARAGWQWTSQDATVGGSQGINGIGGTPSNIVYLDRAFIQFAGFTFGKTQSFFDFYCTGCYSLQTNLLYVDTGGSGTPVAAYTAQFGNGVSATLSIEDYTEQRLGVVNTTVATAFPFNAAPVGTNRGYTVPDIVGALRVDQAWGSAQISGALHDNAASYYAGANQTAHPDDKWGWAVNAGLTLKMPWDPKDTFSIMGTYCEGASRYCSNPGGGQLGNGLMFGLVNTSNVGVGWVADAYFDAATVGAQLELPTMWSGVAAFEHYWTPSLRQSVYGAYLSYETNSPTLDNLACAAIPLVGGGVQGAGCGDWKAWQVGSRLLWNPVANLDIGLDVMYTNVDTALQGSQVATAAQGLPALLNINDTHVWSGVFRVQRNFWP